MTLEEIYKKHQEEVCQTGKEFQLESPNTKLFTVSLVRFKRSSAHKAYFKVVEIDNGKTQYFCPDIFGKDWDLKEEKELAIA